ncbi:MAG: 30S ribosomal protein S9 [Deltaproteobacteria bacterium]|nr:30S ribosomal protein S9 [Deltaproteobacteria bacterium]MBW2017529.1 30S ribosomal protein S9 [Deltaproteobacteria bacterium]MBW2128057.1 30S ribosomal protein S9 [Deltaproteobacteria bacterium]MBW2304077.1 30S ribosomal protein S9 [Deltaproteobacteria bacterium]
MAEGMIHAVGKRKTSVARVWMRPGHGVITINKKPMDEYITRETDKMVIRQPLELTDNLEKFNITINVRGGGISGQAGAIRHGIARALGELDPEYRLILKKAELLTRDSRIKERKKYGQRGARARYQYSKR